MKYDTASACSIPDPLSATVLVTGGSNTMTRVSRYSRAGWLADLPPLSVGRYNHACGGYVSDGDLGLLVTGGENYPDYLDTTELLVPGSGSWRLATGLLPRPMCCMRMATVANTLYLTGGYDIDHRDKVLEFRPETE